MSAAPAYSAIHPHYVPPDNVTIESVEKDTIGEHNQSFHCLGTIDGKCADFYVKVFKTPEINLSVEKAILPRLKQSGIPVARLLFEQSEPIACLALSTLQGRILQDFIDPRRAFYRAGEAHHYLHRYGAMLGKVHALPPVTAVTTLTRTALYDLSEAQRQYLSPHAADVLDWLSANRPAHQDRVLAHGDFHTAHVLFINGEVSGVLDWESAGTGWREFDLAWILRARQAFLNTAEERSAILQGYAGHASWDSAALQWCEVLVYLHYMWWTRGTGTGYEAFALERARAIASSWQNLNT